MPKLTKKELETLTMGLTSGAFYLDTDVTSGPVMFSTKDPILGENSVLYERPASVEETQDPSYTHKRLAFKTQDRTKYSTPVFKYTRDDTTFWFKPTDQLDDIEFKIICYTGTDAPKFVKMSLGWLETNDGKNRYSVSYIYAYEPQEADFALMSKLFNL